MSDSKNQLAEAISSAVSESLENMLFKTVQPLNLVWGKVGVLSPLTGSVTVAFPEKTIVEITGDIYTCPLNDENRKDVYMDTVAEMANIIAGRLMSILVPDDTEFELNLPETGVGAIESIHSGSYIQHFEMDGAIYVIVLDGTDLLDYRKKDVVVEDGFDEIGWGA